jgi:hypothetical protein
MRSPGDRRAVFLAGGRGPAALSTAADPAAEYVNRQDGLAGG